MKALPPIKITFQKDKGLFKKCVGKYIGRDGKRRPKIFWLGADHDDALAKARLLVAYYKQVVQDKGREEWNDEDLKDVEWELSGIQRGREMLRRQVARQVERHTSAINKVIDTAEKILCRRNPDAKPLRSDPVVASVLAPVPASWLPAQTPTTSTLQPTEITLYKAIDIYLEKFKGKRCSDSHFERMEEVLRTNLKSARPDCLLKAIDFIWLDGLCDYFKNRPSSLKDKDKKISASTAKGILRYLQIFFTWLMPTQPPLLLASWRVPSTGLQQSLKIGETNSPCDKQLSSCRMVF